VRVGVTPWDFQALNARKLAEQAAAAEAMGFESFWLPENHFNPNAIPDPLMLLAAVAASTRTIRLATTSYLLPLRHPLLAAEQVAVLDRLSDGRVTLGIGRGFAPAMLKAFDVTPSEKRRLFEDCLGVMRKAWSGEPVPVGDGGDGLRLLARRRWHKPAAWGSRISLHPWRPSLDWKATSQPTRRRQ
jgi:alkanesulfonate monooxygenase SsuD/methylene tetrahydromethanopterin reductase-like flavin-dependent oxidoreductase (luciferase family)